MKSTNESAEIAGAPGADFAGATHCVAANNGPPATRVAALRKNVRRLSKCVPPRHYRNDIGIDEPCHAPHQRWESALGGHPEARVGAPTSEQHKVFAPGSEIHAVLNNLNSATTHTQRASSSPRPKSIKGASTADLSPRS